MLLTETFNPPTVTLSEQSSAIIKTLLYFDVFDYPLTANEVWERCHYTKVSLQQVQTELDYLLKKGMIHHSEGLYYLAGKEKNVQKRRELNERAIPYYSKSKKFSSLISYFPFVQGVFITGSLAKGCMDQKGDIDYLIITKPGRLWLCRGVLVAFKKLFLFNSRKYFCVNYYVDSDSLIIPDQNIFAATEIIHAQPTYNAPVCNKFFEENHWIFSFYPNKTIPQPVEIKGENKSLTKRTGEFLFKGWLGDKADEFFLRVFVWRWRQKFKGTEDKQFEVNFRSRKNVSKHHPQGFQFKVLNALQQKSVEFENKHSVKLS